MYDLLESYFALNPTNRSFDVIAWRKICEYVWNMKQKIVEIVKEIIYESCLIS